MAKRCLLDALLAVADDLEMETQTTRSSRIYVQQPKLISQRLGLINANATLDIILQATTRGTMQFKYFGLHRKRPLDTVLDDIKDRVNLVLNKSNEGSSLIDDLETCLENLIKDHPTIIGPILSGILKRRIVLFFGNRSKDMGDYGSSNNNTVATTDTEHMIIIITNNDDGIVVIMTSNEADIKARTIDRIVRKYDVSARAAARL